MSSFKQGASLGRYELIERVAAGGMAEVFRALQRGDQGFCKQVAVKRILPHLCEEPEVVAMFQDEARLASRLSHPNIAEVYDLAEIDGSLLIAMEWVEGKDLRRVLRRAHTQGPKLTLPRACAILLGVARALACAHTARDLEGEPMCLVHRDVSPHNVMLGFDGGIKLTDFGIAKALGRHSDTRDGTIKGKVAYMSPEQARGEAVDARTDVFALGVVAWEMIQGKRLFSAESDRAVFRALLERPIPSPTFEGEALPPGLGALILGALARDRGERIQSAQGFVDALETIMHQTGFRPHSLLLGDWLRALYPEAQTPSRGGTARFQDSEPLPSTHPSPLHSPQGGSPSGDGSETHSISIELGSAADRSSASGQASGQATGGDTNADSPLALLGSPDPRRAPTRALQLDLPPATPSRWPVVLGGVFALIVLVNLGVWLGVWRRDAAAKQAPPPPANTMAPARADSAPSSTSASVPEQQSLPSLRPQTQPRSTPPPRRTRPRHATKTKAPRSTRTAGAGVSARGPVPTPEAPPATPAMPHSAAVSVKEEPRRSSQNQAAMILGPPNLQTVVAQANKGARLTVRLLDPARPGVVVRLKLLRPLLVQGRILLDKGQLFRALASAGQATDKGRLQLRTQESVPNLALPHKPASILRAHAVDRRGRAGLAAADPTDSEAPLLLPAGGDLLLQLDAPFPG